MHDASKQLLSGLTCAHMRQSQLSTPFLCIAHPSWTLRAYNWKLIAFAVKLSTYIVLIVMFSLVLLLKLLVGDLQRQTIENTQIEKLHFQLSE